MLKVLTPRPIKPHDGPLERSAEQEKERSAAIQVTLMNAAEVPLEAGAPLAEEAQRLVRTATTAAARATAAVEKHL